MRKGSEPRIPSSRTSKAAGIEIGVEKLKELARRLKTGCGAGRTLTEEQRLGVAFDAMETACELAERAAHTLRGRDW